MSNQSPGGQRIACLDNVDRDRHRAATQAPGIAILHRRRNNQYPQRNKVAGHLPYCPRPAIIIRSRMRRLYDKGASMQASVLVRDKHQSAKCNSDLNV